ncbi:glycosyltransferase [Methylobacterium sp. WL9]|uniref:glycosyltransferase n=1 Tax=Methylobacterium sp. WL9 TaxID=2603898 RepID=UPI0011CA5C00|nr:glycosyltransferase [Methylobacterium sp. WL9]TXN20723.1 glycosyltransferase family 4 protein [Methylobacterium sp. WL9]
MAAALEAGASGAAPRGTVTGMRRAMLQGSPVPIGQDKARPVPKVLYWRETTDAQPFETGIQRVTRRLADGLVRRGFDLAATGWDPVRRLLRVCETAAGPGAEWLLLPEIPMSMLGEGPDPIQLAHAHGLRAAAIVHDLIPIRLAQLYGPLERAVYRRYFRMFAGADLVFATTGLVAGHLRAYLEAEGLRVPPIAVVPLPGQFADRPRVREISPPRRPDEPLRLLTVATWEPRKNLPRLLRAVRLAQDRSGQAIHLTLIGRRTGYADHDAEIEALLAVTPGATAQGRIGDGRLAGLYDAHHASVYPSCEEGFGMPVLESLWLGRPCLCHAGSAMAEVAPGGGTLMTDMDGDDGVAAGLIRLATEPAMLERLTAEAVARPLRTWDDYAADVAERLRQGISDGP